MPGLDANVKLLLHCDGADTSTTFTDVSDAPHTVTANGNAQVDTAQSKFGGASLLLDGTGDYLESADHADWDIGASGEYTVDLWVRFPTSVDADAYLIGQQNHSDLNNGGWCILTNSGPNLQVDIQNSTVLNVAAGLSADTWHHIAFERTTTTAYLYRDGTSITSAANTAATSSTTVLRIGQQPVTNSKDFNGWMDEIRVSNVARYGGVNFTPATEAYAAATAKSYLMLMLGIG